MELRAGMPTEGDECATLTTQLVDGPRDVDASTTRVDDRFSSAQLLARLQLGDVRGNIQRWVQRDSEDG